MPTSDDELVVTDDHRAQARLYSLMVAYEDDTWVAHSLDPDLRFVIGDGETPAAAVECLVEGSPGNWPWRNASANRSPSLPTASAGR